MNPVPELTDERLYDLLEAGCEQGRASIRLLAQLAENGSPLPTAFDGPVQASANIADTIRDHLVRATVTSLPKGDLEALVRAIAAIPVAAARFAKRWDLASGSVGGLDFTSPLNWAEEMTEILRDTVRQLRGFTSLNRINELHPRLQTIADRAETQVQDLVKRVYQDRSNPLDVMKVKDLAEQLTQIIDRCREAEGLMHRMYLEFL